MKNFNLALSIIVFILALMLDYYIWSGIEELSLIIGFKVVIMIIAFSKVGNSIILFFRKAKPIATNREQEYLKPILNEIV